MRIPDSTDNWKHRLVAWIMVCVALSAHLTVSGETVRGYVFLDSNRNGTRDATEIGIAGIRVSDGEQIVRTDERGEYRISISNDAILFVIKPKGYMVPVNDDNLPRFYYIHYPEGSPDGLKVPGIAPTGPLPESVDFPLFERPEPERFSVLVFGDPQPGSPEEINIMAHDVIDELLAEPRLASFGVSLGDLADPRYAEYYNTVIGTIGLPWYNVVGNHDVHEVDPAARTDEDADDCFQRVYGPGTYSFDYGNAHFLVIDNCTSVWDEDRKTSTYWAEFRPRVLKFIENDLAAVPRDRLVVLMFHIPLDQGNRDDVLALLAKHPHTLSLSGHYHEIVQWFFDQPGGRQHHHVTCGALSGIHWLGPKDGYGIPSATMHCGSPNGFLRLHVDGNRYRLSYKAARFPENHQMHIYAPTRIASERVPETEVIVNVYMGNERSVTEMKIGESGEWIPMKREVRHDPYLIPVLPKGQPPGNCQHLWVSRLPQDTSPGTHVLHVRSRDMYGDVYRSKRILRVIPPEPK